MMRCCGTSGKILLLVALVSSVAACDVFAPVCTTEARAAIGVFVHDSTTNAPVQTGSLMVVATTGSFSDTLRANLQPSGPTWAWSLAHERAGRYTVEVFVTGYHPWVMSNVRVDEDECHVETRTLTALMQPVE
jgi:hypothetical protein